MIHTNPDRISLSDNSNYSTQNNSSFGCKMIQSIGIYTISFFVSKAIENTSPALSNTVHLIGIGISLFSLFQKNVKPSPSKNLMIKKQEQLFYPLPPVIVGLINIEDKIITFTKFNSQIIVSVKNQINDSLIELPLDQKCFLYVPHDFLSVKEKLNWLCYNHHFELICKKRDEKFVFSLIDPFSIEWSFKKSYNNTEPSYTPFCLKTTLTNRTIAYGSKIGMLYIYHSNGQCLFQCDLKKEIMNIIECPNGLLEVKTSQHTFILEPKKRVDQALLEIKELKRKILINPDQYSLYYQLKLKHPKAWDLYCKGIRHVAKSPCRYQKRKFIENSVFLFPEKKFEIYRYFFNSLDNRKIKEKRAFALQLYRILEKENQTNSPLKMEILGWIKSLAPKKCKTRLLIGEGNFSYTESLINTHLITHPNLAASIIATEVNPPIDIDIQKRINRLMKKNVIVYFNVNAKILHLQFDRRIPRIHWNCPNGGGTVELKNQFAGTVIQFFKSASSLQRGGDRIHITLLQEQPELWKQRQIENDLVLASTEANYRLVAKRLFHERYPEYKHKKTVGNDSITSKKREFVFEKIIIKRLSNHQDNLISKAQKLCDPEIKNYKIGFQKNNSNNCYFECSSDDDSSDYYESDTD